MLRRAAEERWCRVRARPRRRRHPRRRTSRRCRARPAPRRTASAASRTAHAGVAAARDRRFWAGSARMERPWTLYMATTVTTGPLPGDEVPAASAASFISRVFRKGNRHPSESWDPLPVKARAKWIPAFAGMTMPLDGRLSTRQLKPSYSPAAKPPAGMKPAPADRSHPRDRSCPALPLSPSLSAACGWCRACG